MPGELNEQQIRKTAIQLGLPVDFIRKDYFVTKAIRVLSNIENEYFELVFQGGTSLSKGYCLIKRLSEDIDFRVCLKPSALNLGKNAKRTQLRTFRNQLIDTLLKADFKIQATDVRVFYEGRYMCIRAVFTGADKLSYLKPHIAIDCFLGELELKPQIKNVSSMVKVILGEECEHQYFPVACVSLDETAAEKWVALIRRISGANIKERDSDKHLVRHLYDLYYLKNKNCLSEQYYSVLEKVIKKEQAMFEGGADNIFLDPKLVLDDLHSNSKWKEHWSYFLEQMVYESDKPLFEQSVLVIEELSQFNPDLRFISHQVSTGG